MSETTPFQRFHAAVLAGDDEQSELLLTDVTQADVPALMEMYERGGDERWWATRALAYVGGDVALGRLVSALDDESATVRAVAAHGLGALCSQMAEGNFDGNDERYRALAARLSDADGFVRQSAADALAQCGDAAVPTLAETLDSSVEAARVRATYALRKIGTYRAAALLYPLLNDDNPLIRAYAYEGLDDMGLLETLLLRP